MWPNPQETADLVTFTEEVLNGNLHFLCAVFVLGEKKGQSTDKLQDQYGHNILLGELYLEGRYLQKSRSHHPSKKKFNVINHTFYINPGKISEIFVEFRDDLTIGNDSYEKYLNLSFCFTIFSLDRFLQFLYFCPLIILLMSL